LANLHAWRCCLTANLCCPAGHLQDTVGRTALHYAASWGHADVINAILGTHSDVPKPEWDVTWPNGESTRLVDVRNASGFTALHYAVWVDRKEAIKVCK
jgi:ankyrin repeat protein